MFLGVEIRHFFKKFLSNSLPKDKSLQSHAQTFPHPGLHMVAFDLSFTYVLVLVKTITEIFY